MTNATKTRAKAAREARLRTALRENLKRRKAQAQSRAAPSQASGPRSHDSAGIAGKNGPER